MLAKPAVLAPAQQGGGPSVCAKYGIASTDCVATTYYAMGSQRVAMRVQSDVLNDVYWLHGDHLGSASLTTDVSGKRMAEMRYKPFGEVRWSSGAMPTDRQFTGMTSHIALGLVTMGAREYVPSLGRWLSADTIVPRAGDPQAFNRYSYARNSPLGRIDPNGHGDCNVHTTPGCKPDSKVTNDVDWRAKRIDWTLARKFTKNGKVDILAYTAARYATWVKMADAINADANMLGMNAHISSSGAAVASAYRISKFKGLVQNAAPADIKWEIRALAESQGDDVDGKTGQMLFKQIGRTYDADDIGNYGFGILAIHAGVSPWLAKAAGGIAQAVGDIGERLSGRNPNRTIGETANQWATSVSKGFGILESLDEAPDLLPVGTGLANGSDASALDRSAFANLTVDLLDLFR